MNEYKPSDLSWRFQNWFAGQKGEKFYPVENFCLYWRYFIYKVLFTVIV